LGRSVDEPQIARRWPGTQMRMYQDRGIKWIEVTAGKDVGGYAWARYGFVPVYRQGFGREVLKRFKKVRRENGWNFESLERRQVLRVLQRDNLRIL